MVAVISLASCTSSSKSHQPATTAPSDGGSSLGVDATGATSSSASSGSGAGSHTPSKSGAAPGSTSSGAAHGGSTTPTGNQSSPSSHPSGGSPYLAALQGIVLRQSDLPKGWSASAHRGDPNQASYDATLASCIGVKNTDPDRLATANSPDFSGPGGVTFALSTASRYRSSSDLAADKAKLSSSKAIPCFETLVKAELASNPLVPKGSTVRVQRLSISLNPTGYPSNVAGIGHAKLLLDNVVTVYVDLAFITGRLIEAQVEYAGTSLNAATEKALFTNVANRAAAA